MDRFGHLLLRVLFCHAVRHVLEATGLGLFLQNLFVICEIWDLKEKLLHTVR